MNIRPRMSLKRTTYFIIFLLNVLLGLITIILGVFIFSNTMHGNIKEFFVMMLTSVWTTAIIFTGIIIYLLRKHIINPIKDLTIATGEFVTNKNNGIMEEKNDSKSHDMNYENEIEQLTDTVLTIEKNLIRYIDKLVKVTSERDRYATELKLVASIQAEILPCLFQTFPQRNEFNLYGSRYLTNEIGGDFYDYYLIDEEHLVFIIAEVSGKGVSTALFKVIIKSLIKTHAYRCNSPAEILTTINNQLYETNRVGMFVTIFLGILDLRTGVLSYANAGHMQPILSERGRNHQGINSKPGFVLAGIKGLQYKEFQIAMKPGDRLLLFTDRITEAKNSSKIPFGYNRLLTMINDNEVRSLTELYDYIMKEVIKYTESTEKNENITMLFIEFRDYLINKNKIISIDT